MIYIGFSVIAEQTCNIVVLNENLTLLWEEEFKMIAGSNEQNVGISFDQHKFYLLTAKGELCCTQCITIR